MRAMQHLADATRAEVLDRQRRPGGRSRGLRGGGGAQRLLAQPGPGDD